MNKTLGAKEREVRARLMKDFPHYASRCLSIRAKGGGVQPLTLNPAQSLLQEAAERQITQRGQVRLLVLKGRQMGVSTYIEGRFYWRTSHRRGVRAFILTHRDQATQNLFAMAKRFHAACPALVRPRTGASNVHELQFRELDSGYRVATAKAPGVGRSETIQYFHGSEVAFWPNAEEQVSGALQAVPFQPGTEVWLESTANGMGGLFYDLCLAAERGEGAADAAALTHAEPVRNWNRAPRRRFAETDQEVFYD